MLKIEDDVVHLWYCKKPAAEYNLKKLNELSTPVARIKAVHPEGDKLSEMGSADDAGGLTVELVLCVGSRVMFLHNTWLDACVSIQWINGYGDTYCLRTRTGSTSTSYL